MQRLINTVATAGASLVLMAGLWQDWNLMTTLKRMLIAYLVSFFLGSLMALAVGIVPLFDKKVAPEAGPDEASGQGKKNLA